MRWSRQAAATGRLDSGLGNSESTAGNWREFLRGCYTLCIQQVGDLRECKNNRWCQRGGSYGLVPMAGKAKNLGPVVFR